MGGGGGVSDGVCFALWWMDSLFVNVCKCHLIVEPLPFCRDQVQLFFQDLSSHLCSQPVVWCVYLAGRFKGISLSLRCASEPTSTLLIKILKVYLPSKQAYR